MDLATKSLETLIDSEKRDNYETSDAGDCSITMRTILEEGQYALINGFITNSVYTFDSATNVLRFNDGTTRSATITIGYYSASTIAAAVQTAMNDSGTAQTFTVTFSNVTSKLTFNSTGNFKLLGLDDDSSSTAARILGVRTDSSAASSSKTCAEPINLAYNSLGFLFTISESTSNSVDATQANGDFQFYFPCSANYGEVITMQDYHANKIIRMNKSAKLRITVKNSHGRIVDMNNGAWQINLRRVYPC